MGLGSAVMSNSFGEKGYCYFYFQYTTVTHIESDNLTLKCHGPRGVYCMIYSNAKFKLDSISPNTRTTQFYSCMGKLHIIVYSNIQNILFHTRS